MSNKSNINESNINESNINESNINESNINELNINESDKLIIPDVSDSNMSDASTVVRPTTNSINITKLVILIMVLIYLVIVIFIYIIYGAYEFTNNISNQQMKQLIMQQNCSYTETIELYSDYYIMSLKKFYAFNFISNFLMFSTILLKIHMIIVKGAGKISNILAFITTIMILVFVILMINISNVQHTMNLYCNNKKYNIINFESDNMLFFRNVMIWYYYYNFIIFTLYSSICILSYICFLQLYLIFKNIPNILNIQNLLNLRRIIYNLIYYLLIEDRFIHRPRIVATV